VKALKLIALSWAASTALNIGCTTTVRPWERGRLAQRCMKTDLDKLESSRDGHVHATRESMEGATKGAAASSVCN